VSQDRRHLVRHDGTPFFWLGDTAWNGPLKATPEEWSDYLRDRAAKRFSVIQFVATQWISASGDAEGRPAYLGTNPIRIEPAFFRRLDRYIDAINNAGLVAAPVLAWAATWNTDALSLNPGTSLPDDQLVALIRYLVARYGAHDAVWLLAGDGIYEGPEAERWRRIGRAALHGSPRIATIHPGGKTWVAPEFRDEPWFAFHGYQSGHWNDDDNHRWIHQGPPALDWRTVPVCPHINLEPCYEAHRSMASNKIIDAHDVRRASYWSLLAAPPAGVSYGAHGVWSWEHWPESPLAHPSTGVAPAWRDALALPGSDSMRHLADLFASIPWWTLEPRPDLLASQPGIAEPACFISAAASPDLSLAMFYLPEGGVLPLRAGALPAGLKASIIDPATGERLSTQASAAVIDTGLARDRVVLLEA
jgi:hypothetical protein